MSQESVRVSSITTTGSNFLLHHKLNTSALSLSLLNVLENSRKGKNSDYTVQNKEINVICVTIKLEVTS
jgi:hypothetical protein